MGTPTNRVAVEISAEASKATAAINTFFNEFKTKQAFIEQFNAAWSRSADQANAAVAQSTQAAKAATSKFAQEFNAAWNESQKALTQYTFSGAVQKIKDANALLSYPAFTKAGVGAEELAKSVVKSKTALSSFVDTAKQANAGLTSLASATAAYLGIATLRTFVNEAVIARSAAARLGAALTSSGQASAGYTKELEAQRDALKDISIIDDDSLVMLQQRLVTMGVTRDYMRQATQATLDYSAATGIDAVLAARLLGNALSGDEVAGLRGFRIEIDKTLSKSDQIKQFFTQLERQVSGQALAQFKIAPDYFDFIKQLSDLKKELGNIVLNSGFIGWLRDVIALLRAMPAAIQGATLAIAGLSASFLVISTAVTLVVPGITAMAGWLKTLGGIGLVTGPYLTATGLAVAGLAGAATAGAGAIAILVTWMGKLREQANAATAINGMIDSTVKLKQTAIGALNQMAENGGITQDKADDMIRKIGLVNKAWLAGTLNGDEYQKMIVKLAKEVQSLQAPATLKPSVEPLSETILAAYEKGYADLAKAQLESEKAGIEASFNAKLMSEEEYFARRRAIVQRELEWETKLSLAESDALAAEQVKILNDGSLSAGEKKLKVEEQNVKLIGLAYDREKLRVKAKQDIAELDSQQAVKAKEAMDTAIGAVADLARARDQETLSERDRLKVELDAQLAKIDKEVLAFEQAFTAKTLAREIYNAKVAKMDAEEAKRSAQNKAEASTAQISQAETAVNTNWRLTDNEQLQASIELKRRQVEIDQEYIDSLQAQKAQWAGNADMVREYDALLLQAEETKRKDKQTLDVALDAPKLTSFADQLLLKTIQIRSAWGSMARQMADVITNTVTRSVNGLADAMTSVIVGTKSAAQAFSEFAVSMVTSLISSILQAVLYAMVAIPILTALGVLSGGSIPATGLATTTMALAGASSLASRYADGGEIRGPGGPRGDRIPIWASDREWVIQAQSSEYYGSRIMAAINRRLIPRSLLEQYGAAYTPAHRFAFADGGQVNGGESSKEPAQVNVAIYDREDQMARFFESHRGQQVLVSTIRKNAGAIGFRK